MQLFKVDNLMLRDKPKQIAQQIRFFVLWGQNNVPHICIVNESERREKDKKR
ncbi:MAG: hypothetical protein H6569_11705 [Lewinellaceae bacterium]|nr:hypothetical protein [Saprospiraceae bacterium]MCB9316795.1 hypothetical protein [Lewinellaceae bacterium]